MTARYLNCNCSVLLSRSSQTTNDSLVRSNHWNDRECSMKRHIHNLRKPNCVNQNLSNQRIFGDLEMARKILVAFRIQRVQRTDFPSTWHRTDKTTQTRRTKVFGRQKVEEQGQHAIGRPDGGSRGKSTFFFLSLRRFPRGTNGKSSKVSGEPSSGGYPKNSFVVHHRSIHYCS